MAFEYIFNFTDTTKGSFAVFPYTADGPRSPSDPLLIDHAVRASTTLKFVGKGLPDYGQWIEQNLIYLLENFAGNTEPVYPTEGQQWFKNDTQELFIRSGSSTWTATILASGSSFMTGPLVLSTSGDPGDAGPNEARYAVPKGYVDGIKTDVYAHINNEQLHITNYQDTFLDGIELAAVTSDQVATLLGINTGTTVQLQLDDKVSKTNSAANTMGFNVDLTFNGGNIYGLPSVPPLDGTVAVSKNYVDGLIISGAGGDGVLTSTAWLPGVGTVGDINDNIIQLTITYPDLTTDTYTIEGVSRVGHTQPATSVTLNTGPLPLYPSDIQLAVEYIEANKATKASPTFTGTVTVTGNTVLNGTTTANGPLILASNPATNYEAATKLYVDSLVGGGGGPTPTTSTVERTLQLTAGSPVPGRLLTVPLYTAGSNKLFLYVNGIKQYGHTFDGGQAVTYDATFVNLTGTTNTYLDATLDYHFNITVDGVGPTLVTIPSLSSIDTHGALALTINALIGSLGAFFELTTAQRETFRSLASGSTATILIEDPNVGSPILYNYLFNVPAPDAIVRPEFVGDFTDPNPANWTIPDILVLSGDYTMMFPAGKNFTVRGSSTDYGDYNGVYSVYNTGATYNSGTNETSIPVALPGTPAQPTPLLLSYSSQVGGSPAPSLPIVYAPGSIYRTFLGGLVGLETPTVGMDGDYMEVTYAGSPPVLVQATVGTPTQLIEFNYDPPAGMRVEANVFN